MGATLRNMRSKTETILEDGKKLSGKSILTRNLIDELQNYYGLAIRKNTDNLHNMYQTVWAIFYHKMSTDQDPKHGLCPMGEDSWYKYQRSLITNASFSHKNSIPVAVLNQIKPIYKRPLKNRTAPKIST